MKSLESFSENVIGFRTVHAIIGVIALYFYPITKAYNEEMQAELTERRKQTDY